VRAKVGDRYVLEELERHGWALGGEGSGHLLVLDRHTTGDGLVSALQVLHRLWAVLALLHLRLVVQVLRRLSRLSAVAALSWAALRLAATVSSTRCGSAACARRRCARTVTSSRLMTRTPATLTTWRQPLHLQPRRSHALSVLRRSPR
jgi:hypothetical protein